jgi:GNAT superfamily N-acetyltransferase
MGDSMLSFRDATANDADAVAKLINTAFLVERFFIERDRTDPETVRHLMTKGKFLLAEEGSNLAACVYLELRNDRGYFGMLSVEPSRQGKGVGRQLIAAAENYFRGAGCRYSELKIVNVRTELLELYTRLGYVETGAAIYNDPTPTKIPVHFIEMSKHLD